MTTLRTMTPAHEHSPLEHSQHVASRFIASFVLAECMTYLRGLERAAADAAAAATTQVREIHRIDHPAEMFAGFAQEIELITAGALVVDDESLIRHYGKVHEWLVDAGLRYRPFIDAATYLTQRDAMKGLLWSARDTLDEALAGYPVCDADKSLWAQHMRSLRSADTL